MEKENNNDEYEIVTTVENIDCINLKIPFMSVSVNHCYQWKERRYKSEEYKTFEDKINFFFLEKNKKERHEIIWDEWLWVEYKFYFNIRNKNWTIKKKDLMNYEKTLTDALSNHIVWFEDSKIKRAILEKIDSEEEKIEIKIYEIKEEN